jgi:hypothetical protein
LQRKPSLFPGRAAIAERIVDNAKDYIRLHHVVIRVYDAVGNVIQRRARGRSSKRIAVTEKRFDKRIDAWSLI